MSLRADLNSANPNRVASTLQAARFGELLRGVGDALEDAGQRLVDREAQLHDPLACGSGGSPFWGTL